MKCLILAILAFSANAMRFGRQEHKAEIEYRITWQVVDCPKCPVVIWEWCNWADDLRGAAEKKEKS